MNSFNLSITRLFTLLKCFLCCALLASTGTFSAHAQTTPDAPSYAGFWNKANEAGWGLSIQQQGDNVFAAWYTYAADGSPTWFTMSCKLIGNQCKDNLYTVTGKPLSAGLTNIGANATVAGAGSITFNSTSNLTFSYTVFGKTKTITDVLKFNFVAADKIPVCTQSTAARSGLTNYTDMWWGGYEASGWGLSLAHQGDIIFVAFYTYSDDRKAAWTVGVANKVAGTTATYSGDFSTPRTGTPYYDINGTDATTFPAPRTGSFTLTFASGEAATLDYELAVGSGAGASASKGRVALNRFAVASGATTSCAAPTVVPTSDVKTGVIDVGGSLACGVTKERAVACWGDFGYGSRSFGPVIPKPTLVDGTGNVVSVAVGDVHACGLRADGTVVCWGNNAGGTLGNNSYETSKAAVIVSGLDRVVSLGASPANTCAVTSDKSLFCWGSNVSSQLGYTPPPLTNGSDFPVRVNNLSGVVAVGVGSSHVCALKSDSTVACWGDNDFGQLGLGIRDRTVAMPAVVPSLSGVVSLAAGLSHTCTVKADGSASCWGSNEYSQLGTNPRVSSSTSPLPVAALENAKSIGVGFGHTCALRRDGTVACWGDNTYKQCGIAAAPSRITQATTLPGLTDVVELTVGTFTSCALKRDGSAVCWGPNLGGLIGDGTFDGEGEFKTRAAPSPVLGGSIFLR